MPLKFIGGERLQRGRGIGGIFRFLSSVFTPVVKSLGKTAVKAIKSDAGKLIGKRMKEQAMSSAMNLTANALRGNDLNTSIKEELNQLKETAADTLDKIEGSRKRKKYMKGSGVSRKKLKRQLNHILEIDPKQLMKKYSNVKPVQRKTRKSTIF